MDRYHLTPLIRDLVDTANMLLVIDSGAAVAEMHTDSMKKLDMGGR